MYRMQLHKFEESMQNVLAIILSLGNYLNVDTNFGCAYGFKVSSSLSSLAIAVVEILHDVVVYYLIS